MLKRYVSHGYALFAFPLHNNEYVLSPNSSAVVLHNFSSKIIPSVKSLVTKTQDKHCSASLYYVLLPGNYLISPHSNIPQIQ